MLMRCASYVPHPVAGPKQCCGKHAELIPGATYGLRPEGTREYHLTTQKYLKISSDLLPRRNAVPPSNRQVPQNPAARSINCLQIGNRRTRALLSCRLLDQAGT